MSMGVYLYWDGMTQWDKDERTYAGWGDSYDTGYKGYMHDHGPGSPTSKLVMDVITSKEQTRAIPGHRLISRMASAMDLLMANDLKEDEADSESAYVRSKTRMWLGFIARVCELESQGKNPRIHTSW